MTFTTEGRGPGQAIDGDHFLLEAFGQIAFIHAFETEALNLSNAMPPAVQGSVALANLDAKDGRVVIVTIGDGAMNQGSVHEAIPHVPKTVEPKAMAYSPPKQPGAYTLKATAKATDQSSTVSRRWLKLGDKPPEPRPQRQTSAFGQQVPAVRPPPSLEISGEDREGRNVALQYAGFASD